VGIVRTETVEQRLARLTFLRQRIDAEIRELAGQVPLRKRSKRNAPPCGTESGYQRHRYYGEPRCDACKTAHRIYNRARYAAKAAESWQEAS
jgi:hypothetical protein